MSSITGYDSGKLIADLRAGISSALAVLPIALAFGIVSGLGPVAGLYGAAAVGIVTSVAGGTRLQISTPTASVSVAVAYVLVRYDFSTAETLTVLFIAAVLQIAIGFLRLAKLAQFVPYSVVSGFLSAIGVLVIFSQVLSMFGADERFGSPFDLMRHWPDAIANMNLYTVALTVIAFAVCALWPKAWRTFVPSVAGALVVGALVGAFLITEAPTVTDEVTTQEHWTQETVVAPDLWIMEINGISGGFWGALAAAFTVALVGTLTTVRKASEADSLTGHQHDSNWELMAVGVGNAIAAIIGGVPGAVNRDATHANIAAGAQTRAAGVFSAIVALVIFVAGASLLHYVPHAVLSGILMWLGWKLIDWRVLAHLYRMQSEHVLVMLLTLGLCVFVDLLVGLAAGLVMAALGASRRLERLELDSVVSVPMLDSVFFGDPSRVNTSNFDPFGARVGLVKMRGSFTVASSNRLRTAIGKDIHEHEVVIMDFTDTSYIDDSAALVLEELVGSALEHKTEVIVIGLSDVNQGSLHSLDALHHVPGDHFVLDFEEAQEVAARLLDIHRRTTASPAASPRASSEATSGA